VRDILQTIAAESKKDERVAQYEAQLNNAKSEAERALANQVNIRHSFLPVHSVLLAIVADTRYYTWCRAEHLAPCV
jgi:hypothetical protein